MHWRGLGAPPARIQRSRWFGTADAPAARTVRCARVRPTRAPSFPRAVECAASRRPPKSTGGETARSPSRAPSRPCRRPPPAAPPFHLLCRHTTAHRLAIGGYEVGSCCTSPGPARRQQLCPPDTATAVSASDTVGSESRRPMAAASADRHHREPAATCIRHHGSASDRAPSHTVSRRRTASAHKPAQPAPSPPGVAMANDPAGGLRRADTITAAVSAPAR